MTITINGNGTVTGIAVGGLPDGIVDTDMLAAGAVTKAKANSADFGKVGQVVIGTSTGSGVSTSASHDSWQDITGLTATITPQAATSDILIFCSVNGIVCANDDFDAVSLRILDNGGSVVAGITNVGYKTNDDDVVQGVVMHGLSSPSSTSALTYHVEFKNRQANQVHVDNGGECRCRIVLMELLGGAA